ncbi:8555_t:CDS:2, partial [Gigaspora rosea]
LNKTIINQQPSNFYLKMYSNNLEIDVPTRWSRNKASRLLTIYDDNLKIMYSGLGRNDDESAALIANNPFRSSIDVGYFEVYIIEDGCDNGFEGYNYVISYYNLLLLYILGLLMEYSSFKLG